MAYAQERPGVTGSINEHASALAGEWRRLTRAATFVALLTAPAFFLVLFDSNHWSLAASLIITAIGVVMFRGLVEVLARKLIPSPSLYGADMSLKQDDIVARRRYWYWRGKFRRLPIYALVVLALLALCQVFFSFAGVSAPFFKPFTGLREVFPPDTLPQLGLVFVQLPLLFFVNFAIFFGPFLFFAVRQIRGYEPGDASWGVKIDDVRGQAEAKEEITRVISLWQSGEEFEKSGGKRERGLLFLGAPGTGKTMISKAIATNFNCPFVTIPGSGFAGMFIGMDAITVQFLARKARKLAAKWGGQCIVFIDEIDAVGMRRQALGSGMTAAAADSIHDLCFYGPHGAITASGDVIIESREWRERLFAARAERTAGAPTVAQRINERILRYYPGFGMGGGGGGGQALNQLLVVMDGIDEPPLMRKVLTNRLNTFMDAMFVIPSRIGKLRLRLSPPKPRSEQIYFIGACNVPIEVLDPALTRPGRMGRHIWFRTPTKDDRMDILDLYLGKVDHEPDLDTRRRRDELARITNGYSPSMIEQCCSMALTIAHTEGRRQFAWRDIVEAMTTVETGTAQNIEYIQEETRAVAIHEAGHAAASHVYLGKDVESTRLSIRKRGGSLGHHMSLEKEERFSHFRSYYLGRLIVVLGAMAAEHVFYNENSAGVSGDVQSATALAAMMVGQLAMGPDPVTIGLGPGPRRGPTAEDTEEDLVRRRLERIGTQIMNRAGGGPFSENPLSSVLGDGAKRTAAAELLGQAYVTAYALMAANREALDAIADALVAQKELHGDEVGELLDSVRLTKPDLDLMNPATWPEL
ncbi:MAG TPA: AAA family ATPase [Solirubrobacteraceae bacterium]|jgi:ATP-dependent Zn protease|nr:AAA family ATPase [Solirubrobacteraceae bacterium]